MNYILILLALVFSMASVKAQTTSAETQTNSLEQAALQGHPDAQFNLGEMYYYGLGIEQSYEEAFEWFQKAAFQNHAEAQYYLGIMYYLGRSVEQSDELAAHWFQEFSKHSKVEDPLNSI